MVERKELDLVFASLSDPTRRDILRRVAKRPMPIREIAQPYDLSFAAVAKHLTVLERAALVSKTRHGKEQVVTLSPAALDGAAAYLAHYRRTWEGRLDRLRTHLARTNDHSHGKH